MAEKFASIMKKPGELIGGAIQALKGPDVNGLVESFTSEMTMVTEGLYDDQMRLHKEVQDLALEKDALAGQLLESREALEARIEQNQRDVSVRLEDMQKRLKALETKQTQKGKKNGILQQVTVLAAIIAGAWVVVTLLNLLK